MKAPLALHCIAAIAFTAIRPFISQITRYVGTYSQLYGKIKARIFFYNSQILIITKEGKKPPHQNITSSTLAFLKACET